MKKLASFLLTALFFSNLSYSQSTVSVDLQKGSSVVINGSTNLLKFKLVQNGEKLQRKTITASLTQGQNKIILGQNQYAIAIKNFSSDNIIALNGFLKLMKSDEYPNLIVQLNQLQIQPTSEKTHLSGIKANMNFTITGITKTYSFPITATKVGDQYRIDGNLDLNIHDFGLVPPVAMMGLVKVSEWINIDFSLVCKITLKGSLSTETPQ